MLNYKVKGSLIRQKGSYMPVADSLNYLELKFSFSSEWLECEKILIGVYNRADSSKDYNVQLVGNIHTIQGYMITVPGFTFGLVGYDADDNVKVTSQKFEVAVKSSGFDFDKSEPTGTQKTVFDQAVDDLIAAKQGLNYIHIKWAAAEPVADSDMKDVPDEYIGVYCGASVTAPAAYTAYSWYKVKGDRGIQGIQGLQGIRGEKGEQGIQGIQGIQGEKGEQGERGIQGDKGDKGEQGIQGLQGEQGIQGLPGADGVGVRSIVFKETVAAGNVYTVTLTDGSTYEITAPKGADGHGAGDMLANVYDPTGKMQDVYAYADGVAGGKADDSAVVHKTGYETISGSKTFSTRCNFAGGVIITNDKKLQIDDGEVTITFGIGGSYNFPKLVVDENGSGYKNVATENYVYNAVSAAITGAMGGSY